MKNVNYKSLYFADDQLTFIDQTKLPLEELYISTDSYERIALAIERLEIRGAPLIGIAAAYGFALAFKTSVKPNEQFVLKVYNRIASTRPTAVNLFYALDRMKLAFEKSLSKENLYEELVKEAFNIFNFEYECSERIAQNGLKVFKKKSNILTHCNTGALAAGGFGTAFGIIKKAFEKDLVEHVYADETRPLLQGLRLTSFELEKNSIPFTMQSDSSAAVLMQQNKIDLVITGADRIALNGDSANKIGTYNLAVLCNYHNIPFYIAAPTTTIDRTIPSGEEIKIEYRSSEELLTINNNRIAKEGISTFSPAFDVTPAHLITGIITEEDVFLFPYNFIK